MSLDATRWAWTQKLKPTEKLLLLSLADRAGEDHTCFPSIDRLNCDTGLNRKTIIANLESLRKSGLIQDTGERVGKTKLIKKYKLLGVENRHQDTPNSTKNGTVKQSQKRDSTKNGTVPLFPPNSTKNGTVKQSQKRDTESIRSFNLPEEPTSKGKSSLEERFCVFWKAYPKKKSKGQAEKTWMKLEPSEQLLSQMIDSLRKAKTSFDWIKDGGQFIPNPSTWLNAKGWEDDYGPINLTQAPAAKRSPMEPIENLQHA